MTHIIENTDPLSTIPRSHVLLYILNFCNYDCNFLHYSRSKRLFVSIFILHSVSKLYILNSYILSITHRNTGKEVQASTEEMGFHCTFCGSTVENSQFQSASDSGKRTDKSKIGDSFFGNRIFLLEHHHFDNDGYTMDEVSADQSEECIDFLEFFVLFDVSNGEPVSRKKSPRFFQITLLIPIIRQVNNDPLNLPDNFNIYVSSLFILSFLWVFSAYVSNSELIREWVDMHDGVQKKKKKKKKKSRMTMKVLKY
ncbi:hypothetical protein CAEBREN_17760 [Caenorhabditis brenneri]|uniref:Uncharacterized protein n=1 Tax=Caenorhabditis brenneri TaxID=135651 RepID=G0MJ79_CAEBE|nr:hypothetical protein CAEBREN_17760 [Caenorhabditis brenneri]